MTRLLSLKAAPLVLGNVLRLGACTPCRSDRDLRAMQRCPLRLPGTRPTGAGPRAKQIPQPDKKSGSLPKFQGMHMEQAKDLYPNLYTLEPSGDQSISVYQRILGAEYCLFPWNCTLHLAVQPVLDLPFCQLPWRLAVITVMY